MKKSSAAAKAPTKAPKPEIPPDPITAMERKVVGTGPILVTISTNMDYLSAVERIKGERSLKKEILAFFKPLKQEALKGHQILCAKENQLLHAVEGRIKILDDAIVAFDQEKTRVAREVAEKAAAEARAQEEARIKAEADALKKAGLKDEAKALLKEPIATPLVIPQSTVPQVEGLHFRGNATAVVTDGMELLRAITRPSIYREMARAFRAKGAEPANAKDKLSIDRCAAYLEKGADVIFQAATIELVEFRQAKLNDLLRRCGGEAAKIPGVESSTKRSTVTHG